MARGQRRSIDEKIQQKREIIEKLQQRIKSEQDELNVLLTKKREYYKNIADMLIEAELDEYEVAEAIQEYKKNRQAVAV